MRAGLLCLAAGLLLTPGARTAVGEKPVSFAILEDYDKGHDLDDVDRDFALFHELGIRTWRGSFGWDDYEPVPGRFDFAWLHRFAERAAARGIQLRPYIGYTPPWAARRGGADAEAWNNPPADRRRWQRFTRELARAMRRHPNIRSYEIYNEENVRLWWDGTADEYARVLVDGARALGREHAGAPILFGGLVFPDSEWVESVCARGGAAASFEVLPVHAYPETWTPPEVTVENYLDGLSAFADAADAACGRKRIWINETGFATTPGRSERDQAAWWVRAVATFLAHPRVEHIGIYEIKDLPGDKPVIGDAPNHHLGLTRTDRTRKLAFHTVDLLTDLLDTGTLRVADDEVTLPRGPGRHHHYFVRPDGDAVLILWNRAARDDVEVRLPRGARAAIGYELDGRPVKADISEGVLRVALQPRDPRIYRVRF